MLKLTKDLIYAAGHDAGDRHMRAAGRTAWNVDDYDAAVDELERLAKSVDPATLASWGWRNIP